MLTCGVQRAARSMCAACGVRHAACGVRRAACGVRRAACGVRRAACSVQHVRCVRRAACSAQRAACAMCAACGVQRAECGELCVQATYTCSLDMCFGVKQVCVLHRCKVIRGTSSRSIIMYATRPSIGCFGQIACITKKQR